jgi:predicted AlkP superfamily phosphohydrolase/phosphomutase
MRPKNYRMLMLGLDSIDWPLVSLWASEGRLPVLRGLLQESRALMFGESNRPLPGSIWTDIATGASAAVHGFVHEEQVPPNSYLPEAVDASRVAVAPFYKTLSDAGVRCAIVDFPVDYPLADFNGIQVVDWGTEFKLWRYETRPESFAAQLKSRYGDHPLTNYPGTKPGMPSLLSLKGKLQRGLALKQRVAVDLLAQREHEFVFFNFAELHKGGHFFWKFHDRGHPEFTESEPKLVDALRELYEQLDAVLGAVLSTLSDEDDLILITDRGMYADHRGDHLVDDILIKLGLAVPRALANASRERPRPAWLSNKGFRRAMRHVGRHLMPNGVRERLLPFYRAAVGGGPALDWSKTQVFRLPSVGNSYLRLNVAGREPEGLVSHGAQYERLLAEIANQFAALVNVETQERAVDGVYFPAKQFSGPKSAELPDVAILWNSRAPLNSVASDAIGVVSGRQVSDRTGNHRPEGFALFRGPTIAAGGGSAAADARQIAPAVLERFGVSPPAHYELGPPESLAGAASVDRRAMGSW